jgi:hypothetical protein
MILTRIMDGARMNEESSFATPPLMPHARSDVAPTSAQLKNESGRLMSHDSYKTNYISTKLIVIEQKDFKAYPIM